jgi:hypothetical protein
LNHIRNIQNDGIWLKNEPGGTTHSYTFDVWRDYNQDDSVYFVARLLSSVYSPYKFLYYTNYVPTTLGSAYSSATLGIHDPQAPVLLGSEAGGYWYRYTGQVQFDATSGTYNIIWAWVNQTQQIIEYEVYPIIVLGINEPVPITDLPDFPATRPVDYDPDLIWTPDDWTDDVYTPPEWSEPAGVYVAAGGGRYNQNLIAVAKDLVYYEEFS